MNPPSSPQAAVIPISRQGATTAALLIVVGVGIADYLTGHEISLSTFYLLAVALATWFVSRRFGVLVSFLSVVTSFGGDVAAGAQYSSPLIPCWNAIIGLGFYWVVVLLLANLRSMHLQLEERVQQRTAALLSEIAERESLEKEILEISEREQRRIGHDLHDTLCQHLTATAFAGQVLDEKLSAQSLPESADAARIVSLLEEAAALARNVARGLDPVPMDSEGLTAALREMATSLSERFSIRCRFECESPVIIDEATTAMQLYRITQEALTNVVRHAKAREVSIRLERNGNDVVLSIVDDGVGIPNPIGPRTDGLGVRIMAHRASMIGAAFNVRRGETIGTVVTCVLRNHALGSEGRFDELA